MKELFRLLKRPLLYIAAFSFFVNLLLLAPALFMLQVFDRVLTSQSHETLLVLLLGMAVVFLLMLLLDYVRSRLQGVIGSLVAEQLSPIVTRAMLEKSAHKSESVSAEGVRDVAALRSLFSAQGLLALFDTPWVAVYICVIWLAHPLLGASAAVASLLMLILAVLNDRLTRGDIEAVQKQASKATRYLESSMRNAEVAQSLGMSEALIEGWKELNAKVTELQRTAARKSVALAATTRTTRQLVQVLMLSLGAYLVINGEGTPGILVATTILLGRALSPVEQVIASWRILAEARLAFGRLSALLGAVDQEPAHMKLPPPSGRLVAQGLAYRAPHTERMLIGGVSVVLEPGESLAVIGASGAGKSTLARLLTGLWKPSAGTVRLDGVDIAHWPRGDLGPWLGYLPQDVELFQGTVASNIARLGTVDSEKVIRAARQAGLHALILALPDGYDTRIDDLGTFLSPGQRQRIALARALYGAPKLLVLDEPNSNLDGAGERALSDTLKALRGEVTVVVVTHRNTLIQHMDKMLVLDGGRVQHYGSVSEVMMAMQKASMSRGDAEVVAMPRAVSEVHGTSNLEGRPS